MFFIKLFRMIFGSVYFKAYGGFSERFVNLCAENSINIHNVRLTQNGLEASVKAGNYKKLRDVAKRSGMTIRYISKRGLPFFLKEHKNRVGLLFSAVFFALFLFVTSMFIWSVDVEGAENIGEETVLQAVAELGIHQGALKKKINAVDAANKAMITLSGKVSWLAVNIKGTHAVVEVREYVAPDEDETYGEASNIVADFDGLLLSIEAYNGKAEIIEGSGVSVGDLLISGIIENRDTSTRFVDARGKITALHDVDFQSKTSHEQTARVYVSSKSRYTISLFGLKIPLGFFNSSRKNYDEYSDSKYLKYAKTKLPFAVIKTTRAYYSEENAQKSQLFDIAVDEYTKNFYNNFKNTYVVSANIDISRDSNFIIINSNTKSIDFMGKRQKIFIE